MIPFADDEHMKGLEKLAEEFYDNVLRPDEEPAFVSDEASLLDISLASEEILREKVKAYYGRSLTHFDLRRSFWSLLVELDAGRPNTNRKA